MSYADQCASIEKQDARVRKLEKIADWARDVVEVHKSGSDPSWQIAHLEEALAELDK